MAMQVQDIIGMVAKAVIQNPEVLTTLMEHPYSTVRQATGEENVSKEEASQVVAGVSALAAGNQVDYGSLATMAAKLLSENGDSVHALASSMLGGAVAAPVDETSGATAPAAASADTIANLTKLAGSGLIPGVNLSDGIGLDDVIGFATSLLGLKK